MIDRFCQELEDPATWDFEAAERLDPDRPVGVVWSVRFARTEFDLVAGAADRAGVTITDFLRRAAIRAAKQATPD